MGPEGPVEAKYRTTGRDTYLVRESESEPFFPFGPNLAKFLNNSVIDDFRVVIFGMMSEARIEYQFFRA